jgi:gluconokinase
LLLQARIRDAAVAGRGLVLSCSALKRRYRDLLRDGDPDLVFVHLHGDRELIASRMRARPGHFMPVKLLDSQFADLELLGADERGVQLNIKDAPDALVEQAVRYFSSHDQEA